MLTLAISLQTTFALLWVGWILLFVVIEYVALRLAKKMDDQNPDTLHDGGTLSEFTWRLIKRHGLIYMLFTAFLLWLTLHLLTGRV